MSPSLYDIDSATLLSGNSTSGRGLQLGGNGTSGTDSLFQQSIASVTGDSLFQPGMTPAAEDCSSVAMAHKVTW
jgi:hypothetical protein